ncbi:unnamed protein product [Polarella glacialis]|uniref:PA14 domain-containing protein n=1 Tax=Polarella glacialis TaxID=89957 RepID=A0A813FAN9_POLGL|nr:unnamed protein product [Polarella glacialis]
MADFRAFHGTSLLTALLVCASFSILVVPAADLKFADLKAIGRLLAGGTGSTDCTVSGTHALHLGNPVDVATGLGGDVFVLDKDCARVTQVSVSGSSIGGGTVVAGGSQGGFTNNLLDPEALSFDESTGLLYIADTINQRVIRWTPGGIDGVLLVEGNGHPTVGDLAYPVGVWVQDGILFVSEELNHRIQMFELATCCANQASAVAQILFGCPELIPPAVPPAICSKGYDLKRLRAPSRITMSPSGEFFVADTYNHRVLRFHINDTRANPEHEFSNVTTVMQVVAGTTGIAGCRPEQLNHPAGVAVDSDGYLYVADTGNHRVQKFAVQVGDRVGLTVAGDCCCRNLDALGEPVGGSDLSQLNGPKGLAIESTTGALIVVDAGNRRVLAFGGVGHEVRSSPGSSCGYGVSCNIRLFGDVATNAKLSQILVVRRDKYYDPSNPLQSPCGNFNCSIAHWPGLTNPQRVGGAFLDTFPLGMPQGPPSTSDSGLGEYALCWAEMPNTPCVGFSCKGENNCSNSSSWLCGGAQPMGLWRKQWWDVPGNTVSDLQGWPAFPDSPQIIETVQKLEGPINYGDHYRQQFYGLFAAPLTGMYTFHVTSDMNSELRISSDFNDTVGEVVAFISQSSVWVQNGFPRVGYAPGPDSWTSFPTQSGTYAMEAGQLYWFEVLHKEGTGDDFLRAGVTLPNGTVFKPLPATLFSGIECKEGFPEGLAVVHDCHGRTTGQSCTAQCQGGWIGDQQTFICDGVGRFHGKEPVCRSINCEEYSLEVGSLYMHGVWKQVDCTNMGEGDCGQQLGPWAGPGNCVARVATRGSSCLDFCASRGRSCVKSTSDTSSCSLSQPGQVFEMPTDSDCKVARNEQVCVCAGPFSASTASCLLSAWCDQGLMTSGGRSLAVHFDAHDDVVVADTVRGVVVRWTGPRYEVVAGGRGAGNALNQLSGPTGLYFVNGTPSILYIADTENHRIVKWTEGSASGEVVFGSGSTGQSLSQLRYPIGVYMGQNGTLYVIDYGNARFLQVPSGTQTGELMQTAEAFNLPIMPTTAAHSFFDGLGSFYSVDYGARLLKVCVRTLTCSFADCRDVNYLGVYGPSCGCIEDHSNCFEAVGVLDTT